MCRDHKFQSFGLCMNSDDHGLVSSVGNAIEKLQFDFAL